MGVGLDLTRLPAPKQGNLCPCIQTIHIYLCVLNVEDSTAVHDDGGAPGRPQAACTQPWLSAVSTGNSAALQCSASAPAADRVLGVQCPLNPTMVSTAFGCKSSPCAAARQHLPPPAG